MSQPTATPAPLNSGHADLPPRWRLRLLGAVELLDLQQKPQRQHPREELVELLWPDVDNETGRNRLRQALSVLRSLLEPALANPNANRPPALWCRPTVAPFVRWLKGWLATWRLLSGPGPAGKTTSAFGCTRVNCCQGTFTNGCWYRVPTWPHAPRRWRFVNRCRLPAKARRGRHRRRQTPGCRVI